MSSPSSIPERPHLSSNANRSASAIPRTLLYRCRAESNFLLRTLADRALVFRHVLHAPLRHVLHEAGKRSTSFISLHAEQRNESSSSPSGEKTSAMIWNRAGGALLKINSLHPKYSGPANCLFFIFILQIDLRSDSDTWVGGGDVERISSCPRTGNFHRIYYSTQLFF